MANVILTADGQTLEIDDEIAGKDDLLRKALAPSYPDIANADLKRSTVNGTMEVRVTKRAGTKGGPFAELLAAPSEVNPALAAAFRLDQDRPTTAELMKRPALIDKKIARANKWERAIDVQRRNLCDAPGEASTDIPLGF